MSGRIIQHHRLEPYFKIATESAKKSPCLRRQYGAVVVTEGPTIEQFTGYNERVSHCCGGGVCSRTMLGLDNGERVEVGGEIHAETAVLIKSGRNNVWGTRAFILVGYAGKEELFGRSVYPCHTCALNIKFAGYQRVYLRESKNTIIPVPINEIIKERELSWQKS